MKRDERPGRRRANDNSIDPLDKALRQIGAEMLDEPVPDRLRQILRQARRDFQGAPDAANGRRPQRSEGR